ncbi:MAG: dihydroneopterin aldolase family protein [Methanosarcinaceae archaeon]|nr:dihydroneopterin aldolase family protein [Methanosarcinaceae archaeon]
MSGKDVTDRDNALFEAGIKLGALYHQFTGSPVNLKTVESLENAIAQSISVQPFVEDITVSIDRDMVRSNLNDEFGYCELEGRMLDVRINVKYGLAKVRVALEFDAELKYPMMRIESVE